jgi:hypothetical protein
MTGDAVIAGRPTDRMGKAEPSGGHRLRRLPLQRWISQAIRAYPPPSPPIAEPTPPPRANMTCYIYP